MTVLDILMQVSQLVSGGDWKMIKNENGEFRLFRDGEVEAYCPFTALRRALHGSPELMGSGFAIGKRMGLDDNTIRAVISAADNRVISNPGFYVARASFEIFSKRTFELAA